MSGARVSFEKPRRYRSGDRDLQGQDLDLVLSMGGNGDWYVMVVKHGEKLGPAVRVTSSGIPSNCGNIPAALAQLYNALPEQEVTAQAEAGLRAAHFAYRLWRDLSLGEPKLPDGLGACAGCGRAGSTRAEIPSGRVALHWLRAGGWVCIDCKEQE
jgi:hypothetical protein